MYRISMDPRSGRGNCQINTGAPSISDERARKFACLLCDFRAFYAPLLVVHKSRHVNKSRYQCPNCSYSVMKKDNLKNHLIFHHLLKNPESDETHREELLEKNPDHNIQLPQQELGENPESNQEYEDKASTISKNVEGFNRKGVWYECAMHCNYRTMISYNMKQHEVGHKRNQNIKCALCSFSSNKEFVVTRHWRLHHRQHTSTFEADISTPLQIDSSPIKESEKVKSVVFTEETRIPTKKLRKRRMYSCKLCEYKTRWLYRFQNHSYSVHQHGSSSTSQHPRPNTTSCIKSKNEELQNNLSNNVPEPNPCWRAPKNEGYQKITKFKCHRCTFSSYLKSVITRHVRYYHHQNRIKMESSIIPKRCDALENWKINLPSRNFKEAESMNDDVPINLCINDDTEVHNALSKLVADTSYDAGCFKEVQCDTNEEIEDNNSVGSSIEVTNLDKPIPTRDLNSFDEINMTEITEKDNGPSADKEVQTSLTSISAEWNDRLNEELKSKQEIKRLRCAIENIRKEVKQQQECQTEKNRSIQHAQIQIAKQREEILAIEEKLAEFSSKKNRVKKEIKEIWTRKLNTELDLRTLECKDLQLRIAALKHEDDNNSEKNSDESSDTTRRERIQHLMNELVNMENELVILKKEEEILVQTIEDSRRSAVESEGKLHALQSQLEELATQFNDSCLNCQNNDAFLNRLIGFTEESVLK